MAERIFTKREAAEYLRVSTRTIDNYMARGIITGRRAGPRKVLFTESDIDAFVASLPNALDVKSA